MRYRDAIGRDDGHTLSELIVVIGLLGIILAAAWMVFGVVQQGSKDSNRDAWLSREVGQPLEYAERIYMQQLDITFKDASGATRDPRWWCRTRTDRDHDNRVETYTFEVTTDGRMLVTSLEEIDSPTPRVVVWSTNNRNRLVAPQVPFFRYFDIDGVEITGQPVDDIQQYAASMLITVVAEYDGEQLTDSRRIFFRNL